MNGGRIVGLRRKRIAHTGGRRALALKARCLGVKTGRKEDQPE
jgi:hypothetical protein